MISHGQQGRSERTVVEDRPPGAVTSRRLRGCRAPAKAERLERLSAVQASRPTPASLPSLFEGEDPLPVILHADDDPAALLRLVIERLREDPHLSAAQPL